MSNNAKTVLFYGMSASGKGTQARLLVDKLQATRGTHFIEVGKLLRDYATNEGTNGAFRVRQTIDSGQLVPPSIAAYLWTDKLLKNVAAKDHVVFDGAARTVDEAKLFNETLRWFDREYIIFILEIDEETARERAITRGEGRSDDNDKAMAKRLKWFTEETIPAVEYMSNLGARVHHIDGSGSIEEIHKEILSKLNL